MFQFFLWIIKHFNIKHFTWGLTMVTNVDHFSSLLFWDKCPNNPKPKNIPWVKYTTFQGWKIMYSYKFSNFIPSSHFRNVVMQGCKIIWENYIFCWLYHWICSIYQCLHSSNIFKLTQRLHLNCKDLEIALYRLHQNTPHFISTKS